MSVIEKCQRFECSHLYDYQCLKCHKNYCEDCIKRAKHRCEDMIAIQQTNEAGSGKLKIIIIIICIKRYIN